MSWPSTSGIALELMQTRLTLCRYDRTVAVNEATTIRMRRLAETTAKLLSVPNMPPLYKTSGKHHNLLSAVAWVSAVRRGVASFKWPTLPSVSALATT